MIRKAIVAALALLAACSGEKPKDPAKPEGYARTFPIALADDQRTWRIALPVGAMIALQRADAGDVRIFDAGGKVISLAREPANTVEQRSPVKVPTYPIAGLAAGPGASAVSVQLELDSGVRVKAEQAGNLPGSASAALLFDTRAIAEPVAAVRLDADLPVGKPIEVTLEASGDLKNWEPIGSKVLFRGSASAREVTAGEIRISSTDLKDRYLRASWSQTPGLSIGGGSLITTKAAMPDPMTVPTRGAVLVSDHDLRFALPEGLAPRAIVVSGTALGGVIPAQLYGREGAERPWTALAAGTLRGSKPAVIDVGGGGYAEYKLEADARSAGFSEVPKIELSFEPIVLLAAFNGKGPYTLSAGNKAAAPAYFSPEELLGQSPLDDRSVPIEVASTSPEPPVVLSPPTKDGPYTPRKLALWAALLAAVGVLAFAAIRLMKASANPPAG